MGRGLSESPRKLLQNTSIRVFHHPHPHIKIYFLTFSGKENIREWISKLGFKQRMTLEKNKYVEK